MRIQTKTTILFTILTGIVIFILSVSVYYFSERFVFNDFHKRLELRARISARVRFEKNETNSENYKELQKQYLERLPEEIGIALTAKEAEKGIEGLPDTYIRDIIAANGATVYYDKQRKHYAGILYKEEHTDYLIIKSATNDYATQLMHRLRNILLITYIFSVIMIYTVGRYFSQKTFQPVRDITARVKEIKASNLHLRLSGTDSKDEIGELLRTFNRMLDRIETAFESQHNFISNASHELRTPLTTIAGEAEYALSRERSTDSYRQSLEVIAKETATLRQLTNGLLALAQSGFDGKKQRWEKIRVDQLLFDVKENMDAIIPGNNIVIKIGELPSDECALTVDGNNNLLKIALGNIMLNACKYSSNKKVSVSLAVQPQMVLITVADSGIGIPTNELKHIFDPFFRASNTRLFEGHGIGLPLANNIIRLHKGKIEVQSQERVGTSVRIFLPSV